MSKLVVPAGMQVSLVDGDLRLIGDMLPPVTVLTSPDNDNTLYFNENGLLHRLDGPARKVSYKTKHGFEYWYNNGQLHRLNGPACVYEEGITNWYNNGRLHRVDGPAIEHKDGTKQWYQHGLLHRLDGPAIERKSGSKEWYVNGIEYSKEDFQTAVQKYVDTV